MFQLPEWTFEFHGHRCPFMPIGFRMGDLMLKTLGAPKAPDHDYFMYTELGIGHPQTCMMDGLQASTGCTYGKLMMERLNYGKLAAILWTPNNGAVRIAVKPDFVDKLGKYEFFDYRKKGIEPSQIPEPVRLEVINVVLNASDNEMFAVKKLPDFAYDKIKGSFNKAKCEVCGEYVFERYLRRKDGKLVCIPCSGYEQPLPLK
ncbi:MAG: FmdE family protein [candidate division KSB1 bacterium]|nr:FmdE family protein [candidate division KSB1 bacterium]MDZ7303692.1 FmdE family protein [candidate division KSB1 bacterium]MDZ7313172.1 FmdE family protein [candidate division KSB1 bacterium]